MSTQMRFTSKDLENLPDMIDGTRYEIIDGELFISRPTEWNHQGVCGNLGFLIKSYDKTYKLGDVVHAPGLIFNSENAVAPDSEIAALELISTLYETDILKSPNLKGFSCNIKDIFEGIA
jgi:Uma2 family endonuclease